jgi:hypothetical protein
VDLNKLIAGVKAMFLTPKREWPVVAGEPASLGDRFTIKVSGGANELDDLNDALGEVDLRALEGLKSEGVKEK